LDDGIANPVKISPPRQNVQDNFSGGLEKSFTTKDLSYLLIFG